MIYKDGPLALAETLQKGSQKELLSWLKKLAALGLDISPIVKEVQAQLENIPFDDLTEIEIMDRARDVFDQHIPAVKRRVMAIRKKQRNTRKQRAKRAKRKRKR